jgi:cytochrome d ubiquinol oxidase subunit I
MSMRMEMTSFYEVLFNDVAQAKFVHTVSAGYVTASVFVLGVSAWYLLKGRHTDLARRSIAVAASFGLASALSVVVLGDESGYSATHSQKMKLAAIEGMWETEGACVLHRVRFSRSGGARDPFMVQIPYDGADRHPLADPGNPGIDELEAQAEERIRSGLIAYDALMHDPRRARECRPGRDRNVRGARPISALPSCCCPMSTIRGRRRPSRSPWRPKIPSRHVWPLFWAFRIMVGLGFLFIGTMVYFFFMASFRGMRFPRPALHLAVWMIPRPGSPPRLGWFVAEFGRQPWTVDGVLPTAMSVSHLSATEVLSR